MYKFKCKNCNVEFEAYNKYREFCGKSCGAVWSNQQRKGYRNITVSCDYCNINIIMRKCEYSKHIKKGLKNFYCSKKCMGLDKIGDKRPQTSKSILKAYKTGRLIPPKQKYRNGGYRKDLNKYFRSSWEADIVRVLNYLNIKWLYEPEVFTLNINDIETTYRPDFYLPEIDLWIEVKGYWFNELSKLKYKFFRKEYDILLIDEINYYILYQQFNPVIENWEGKKRYV